MAFTPITITASFENPDGSTPAGTITATLSGQMQNGTEIVDPEPIAGQISSTGTLVTATGEPFVLKATNDAGTEPAGRYYTFTIQIDNTPLRTFATILDSALVGGTVDISTLDPSTL